MLAATLLALPFLFVVFWVLLFSLLRPAQSGVVKRSTYLEYAKEAAGLWQVVLILISMAGGQVLPVSTFA